MRGEAARHRRYGLTRRRCRPDLKAERPAHSGSGAIPDRRSLCDAMNTTSLLQQWSRDRSALAAALAPRTVAIALRKHRSLSGMRWRAALVVTAAEALAGNDEALVVSDSGEIRAPVVACDLATDVAVLRIAADQQPDATIAGTSSAVIQATDAALQAGAGVVIVGRSRGGPLVGFGTVRAAGRAWRSRRGGSIAQRLEFDAALDGRFEGALVADLAGVPKAMLVPGPRGRLLGIPAATIERIVAAVQQHGYLPRAYLGLRLQALWLDEATRARWGRTARSVAAVAGVEPESPAEASGIAPGDLLEAIDGMAVDDVEGFAAQIAQSSPGSLLALRLRRGGEPRTVEIKLAEWRQPRR
jgi:S1-C subfamily serine protease